MVREASGSNGINTDPFLNFSLFDSEVFEDPAFPRFDSVPFSGFFEVPSLDPKRVELLSPKFTCGVKDTVPEEVQVPAKAETCTLMGSEIPAQWLIKIGEDPFDLRYFVKAILTQKSLVNPYNRQPFSPEELHQICNRLGISPQELSALWDSSEGIQGFGQILQAMSLIGRVFEVSIRLQQSQHRNNREAIARDSQELNLLQRQMESIGGVHDEGRKQGLAKLLDQAAENGKISREQADDLKSKLVEGA